MADRAFLLVVLVSAICGCSSIRHYPKIGQQHSQFAQGVYMPEPGEWSLENLKPEEGIVLVDGIRTEISVEMRASGKGWYEIWLFHDKKHTDPYTFFVLESEEDDIAVFVTPKWSISVRGSSEQIVIALYAIERTEAGRTISRTLLKQYWRRYYVVCNREEFKPVLYLKRLFRYCNWRGEVVWFDWTAKPEE